MKKLFFTLILIPIFTFAQECKIIPSSCSQSSRIHIEESIFVTEAKESPFLYNQWKEGYLIINDSIASSQKKIHYNLETGELVIGTKTGKTATLTGESLTGFVINDKNTAHHFFTKINEIEFENSDSKALFYEVIYSQQKINYLIKTERKYILGLHKNKGYKGSTPLDYKKKISYYIKNNYGKYVEIKLNKRTILKVLDDKNLEVKAFALSNKINFNKEHDVIRVLDYYYTL